LVDLFELQDKFLLSSALLGSSLVSNNYRNVAVLEWGCWCTVLVIAGDGKLCLSVCLHTDWTSA